MPDLVELTERRMITRIAHMYHVEGQKQADIARKLRISQATVSRMLRRAQRENIVRTVVVPPEGIHSDLEGKLRETFGLDEAVVVECYDDSDPAISARIAAAAARFLETTLREDEVVGVSNWSQTVVEMMSELQPMRLQKIGSVVKTMSAHLKSKADARSQGLATNLSKASPSEANLPDTAFPDPSSVSKSANLTEKPAHQTLNQVNEITLAVVGIDPVVPSETSLGVNSLFAPSEISALADAGGVGHMNLQFFDAQGAQLSTSVGENIIALPVPELSKIDRVMALAGGRSKTVAITGALRSGIIDVLITDKFTAERIVAKTALA